MTNERWARASAQRSPTVHPDWCRGCGYYPVVNKKAHRWDCLVAGELAEQRRNDGA